MVGKAIRKFGVNEDGAIAPLYALSLFGLVAMAGVGFDYARVMALDSELQNAADQAALAAASQLDGKEDSIVRAIQATNATFASSGSDFVNVTRLSNIDDDADGETRPITQISYTFWEDYVDDAPVRVVSEQSTPSNAATKAKIVQVAIGNRQVRYALTPIVGAITGNAGATAMASLTSAYCKVPPLMFCAPPGFDADDYFGSGLKMHSVPSTSTDSNPGIFGFLDFPYTRPEGLSGNNLTTSLGWANTNENCTGEEVEAQPGIVDKQGEAFNTRFGVYQNGIPDCMNDGSFCASRNQTKQLVETKRWTQLASEADADAKTCTSTGGTTGSALATDPAISGDIDAPAGYEIEACVLAGDCSPYGRIGDGWTSSNFSEYMSFYHGGTSANSVFQGIGYDAGSEPARTPTRYEVYQWENADYANRVAANDNVEVGRATVQENNGRFSVTLYCARPEFADATQLAPSSLKDRRALTIAAVDCTDLRGSGVVDIINWVDVFLLTTTASNGQEKSFYVEMNGEATPPGANNSFQGYTKRKAVLIR
ncbi:pilus assembly protein TadG-related protein [Croceicoccus sediminis]|uniref:pilus assembly protein TadG-related protein n=1 Tax=Croceicoccus sediminis TaxID=2571150 RepID=UPI0011843C8B|nr:pilus assembly protein TadG-related protein [Croceicoccus sediminis]